MFTNHKHDIVQLEAKSIRKMKKILDLLRPVPSPERKRKRISLFWNIKNLVQGLSIRKLKMIAPTVAAVFLLLSVIGGIASAGCPIQPQTGTCVPGTESQNGTAPDLTGNPITKDIQMAVNFLSAGVGIVVVAVIIIGGIQYMTAGDNPQALTTAKHRITNGLIALMAFLLTFAFLNWLIPGGVFK